MNEEFWARLPAIPGFDCVKMKQDIQAQIYEEIKDLSPEELLAYFNRAGNDYRRHGRIMAREAKASMAGEEPAPYRAKPPQDP